jgi:hypothetical protein
MLSGDIFYLDYRDFKVHFPAHRFVLVGFDDSAEIAYVADRIDPEPQACSYRALAKSRNPPEGITTFNLWGKFFDTAVSRSPEDACREAIITSIARMTGKDTSQVELLASIMKKAAFASGINGIKRFGQWMDILPEHPDAVKTASFFAQTIEKFGSGGGLFRRFYSRFLDWAHQRVPDLIPPDSSHLCRLSADHWTDLALGFDRICESPKEKRLWKDAKDELQAIIDLETGLFEGLNSHVA